MPLSKPTLPIDSFTQRPRWVWIPIAVFLFIAVNGALLGLTDDEAYYWVLAQRPAWGYAYHPPAIAWLIGAFQWLLGPVFGTNTPGLVRLPAALIIGILFLLSLRWLERVDPGFSVRRSTLILLSFPGIFALSWMMVPDLPLFLGWITTFYATYEIVFRESSRARFRWLLLFIFLGVALSILSKFSGVLVAGSCFLALLRAPRERRLPAISAAVLGGIAAAIPILTWNIQHEWGSLLYQLQGRHGGGLSLRRYGIFWASQILVAGPGVIWSLPLLIRLGMARDRVAVYLLYWMIPAALVFLIQPLFSEFKPHWALAVWLPGVLGLAAFSSQISPRLVRAQIIYGITLSLIIFSCLHFPFGAMLAKNPRQDVSGDLHGWSLLPEAIPVGDNKPVIGSRYQTASQAAFALGNVDRVTLVPRDLKSKDEWAILFATDHYGPDWPTLLKPVYFVTDNRYNAGPRFKNATCAVERHIVAYRFKWVAKEIDLWLCVPASDVKKD